jgi:hypothetical protein
VPLLAYRVLHAAVVAAEAGMMKPVSVKAETRRDVSLQEGGEQAFAGRQHVIIDRGGGMYLKSKKTSAQK